jgi:hypothetical protein
MASLFWLWRKVRDRLGNGQVPNRTRRRRIEESLALELLADPVRAHTSRYLAERR